MGTTRHRLSVTTRLGAAAMALLTTAAILFADAPPAHAVDAAAVVAAVQQAYSAYKMFAGGQLTLDDATTRIVDAIQTAKNDLVAHIDLIATVPIRACARSAVIDLVDIRALRPDALQTFARGATDCADQAKFLIETTDAPAAIDQVGFALNSVGPVALLARAYAGLGTALLKSDVIAANQTLMAKLAPACRAIPLTGDREPGRPLEYELICTAYNGNSGFGSGFGNRRLDFSFARAQAMEGTSYPVAAAALPLLNS